MKMKKMAVFAVLMSIAFTHLVDNPTTIEATSSNNVPIFDYSDLARYNLITENLISCSKSQYGPYYVAFYYRFSNGSLSMITLQLNFYDETVYTPNGTDVSLPSGNNPTSYLVLKYLDDLPESVKNDISAQNASNYNLILTNGNPTTRYNCHSYAWYSQITSTNDYWINLPTAYYLSSDMSYVEVSTPRAGDIICYFDDNDTANDETDDINLHSGIVLNYDSSIISNNICGNANQFTVRSKWGMNGLYTHMGDECPYTLNHGGTADYIKFFRPRINDIVTLINPSSNTTQYIDKNCSIAANSDRTNNYALYDLDVISAKSYSFEITSNSEMNVRLYDKNMHDVSSNILNVYDDGTYTVQFKKSLSSGHYYLRVAYSNSLSYGTIHTRIINSHVHSYNAKYRWRNYIQHDAKCTCNQYSIQPHVVSENAFNSGSQYATCLLCGGLASLGLVSLGSSNKCLLTNNGSYILPNGVIILVDADFEAYIEGKLVI